MKTFAMCAMTLVAAAGAANAEMDLVSLSSDFSRGLTTDTANLNSLRAQMHSGFGGRGITTGDTYGAAVLGQSTAGAGHITNAAGRATTFTYNETAKTHGTLIGSNATVRMEEFSTFLSPNTLRVIVAAYTADGSNIWQSGITIGGVAMTQGRFDVGAGAFPNGLLWDNAPGAIASVSIFNAVFIDGVVAASSSALTNGATLPNMGSVVVWNGVVNSGVDETWMVFDVTFVPAPSSLAVLAFGGIVAGRRRR